MSSPNWMFHSYIVHTQLLHTLWILCMFLHILHKFNLICWFSLSFKSNPTSDSEPDCSCIPTVTAINKADTSCCPSPSWLHAPNSSWNTTFTINVNDVSIGVSHLPDLSFSTAPTKLYQSCTSTTLKIFIDVHLPSTKHWEVISDQNGLYEESSNLQLEHICLLQWDWFTTMKLMPTRKFPMLSWLIPNPEQWTLFTLVLLVTFLGRTALPVNCMPKHSMYPYFCLNELAVT